MLTAVKNQFKISFLSVKYALMREMLNKVTFFTNITFMTKAESKNMAVACSSVICRYLFLKEFAKISEAVGIDLPKGSGPKVDEVGKLIVEKFGQDKLAMVAKLNFKNTERILN